MKHRKQPISTPVVTGLVFLMLLPLFKPNITQTFEYLHIPSPFSPTTYSLIILVISIVLALFYFQAVGLDLFGGLMIAFFSITALATVANKGDLTFWSAENLPCLGLALGVYALWRQYSRQILRGAMFACSFYLALNLVFLVVDYLSSSGSENYLFYGYRNVTFRIAIPALACSLLFDSAQGSRPSARTLIIFLVGLLEMLIGYSATSLCAFIIMALIVGASCSSRIRPYLNGVTALVFYAISFIGIIVLRIQDHLGFIIEGVLGRSTSLTGRTYIWDEVFNLLDSVHFIKGYGASYIWNSIVVDGTPFMHAHNELLHIVMVGGVLAALAWGAILAVVACCLYRNRSNFGASVLSATLFAYCIIGLAEITFFTSTFFMLAIMYSYCRDPDCLKKEHRVSTPKHMKPTAVPTTKSSSGVVSSMHKTLSRS